MVANREILELLLREGEWVNLQHIYNTFPNVPRGTLYPHLQHLMKVGLIKHRDITNPKTGKSSRNPEFALTNKARDWCRQLGGSFVKGYEEFLRARQRVHGGRLYGEE